jgi:hypothetical protein
LTRCSQVLKIEEPTDRQPIVEVAYLVIGDLPGGVQWATALWSIELAAEHGAGQYYEHYPHGDLEHELLSMHQNVLRMREARLAEYLDPLPLRVLATGRGAVTDVSGPVPALSGERICRG